MSTRKTRQKNASSQSDEEQSLPRQEVERFFREIGERAWTDAEKELDSIRQESNGTDWSRGYVKALEGILLTFRSGDDKYIFLPRALQNSSSENLESLKREFAEFSKSTMHGFYDRGFFRALEDYLSLSPGNGTQLTLPAVPPTPIISAPKLDQDEE